MQTTEVPFTWASPRCRSRTGRASHLPWLIWDTSLGPRAGSIVSRSCLPDRVVRWSRALRLWLAKNMGATVDV
jgi:hypothetical protein